MVMDCYNIIVAVFSCLQHRIQLNSRFMDSQICQISLPHTYFCHCHTGDIIMVLDWTHQSADSLTWWYYRTNTIAASTNNSQTGYVWYFSVSSHYYSLSNPTYLEYLYLRNGIHCIPDLLNFRRAGFCCFIRLRIRFPDLVIITIWYNLSATAKWRQEKSIH